MPARNEDGPEPAATRDESHLERVDRLGGLLAGRLAGSILLVAVLLVPVPIVTIASIRQEWTAVAIAGGIGLAMLGVVRWLLSPRRRLSDMGD